MHKQSFAGWHRLTTKAYGFANPYIFFLNLREAKKESLKFAVETSGIYEASKDFSCKSPEGYS